MLGKFLFLHLAGRLVDLTEATFVIITFSVCCDALVSFCFVLLSHVNRRHFGSLARPVASDQI